MSEQAIDNGQSADENSIMSLIHELNSALPFDEFMELALYHPNYGYYTSDRKRVGTDGDFITSVSVGQCFGMVLAHHFAPFIESLASSSDEVVIVELGAEEGDLAKDMMDALSDLVSDSVFERLRYVAVEPFPPKRVALRSNFIRDGLDEFEIISGFNELSVKNCILIANEVLDAIPVKRIRWNGREWDEVCVMVVDDWILSSDSTNRFSPFSSTTITHTSSHSLPFQRILLTGIASSTSFAIKMQFLTDNSLNPEMISNSSNPSLIKFDRSATRLGGKGSTATYRNLSKTESLTKSDKASIMSLAKSPSSAPSSTITTSSELEAKDSMKGAK
jgi:hypothetical protein